MQPKDQIDIRAVLDHGSLEMHFQPIASVRRGSVLGVEALVRARDHAGQAVSPALLFEQARKQKLLAELDEHCQWLALEIFAPLHRAAPEMLLFLNVDAISLTRGQDERVSFLQTQAAAYGIDPRNVVIEILENRFADVDKLRKAVAKFRKSGFLVALDDIGTGESNLDRITYVQPDLIKADRCLIQGIQGDYFKQEVFKALVQLSERIGGWIVAEGVETREEALTVLDLGGDIVQGFYIGRPEKLPSDVTTDVTADRNSKSDGGKAAHYAFQKLGEETRRIGTDFKQFALEKIRRAWVDRQERLRSARCVQETLEGEGSTSIAVLENVLRQAICDYPLIESASILDRHGIQLTDSVLAPGKSERQRSVIYAPPGKGSDHSLKEYVYVLMELSLKEYETVPYVPLPNTDLCITVTTRYRVQNSTKSVQSGSAEERILCLHMRVARGVLERDPVPELIDSDSDEMPRRQDGM